MKATITPKVTLVGAGPGDPDLITLKGLKALGDAQVVLYDALISRELLNYASKKAQKIYVGKRKGFHRYSQDEINKLAVRKALKYGCVVRLKGGDPFVFARGAEEIDYVSSFGIETEVISGVSSSMAVPAGQGIPMTKRGISESFWVITGTTSDKGLSKDVYLAAQSSATIVILMGMNKLNDITVIFKKFNKGDLPVAIIQNGTTKNERVGFGTINTISEIVEQKKLSSPAIIVVGKVVKESLKGRSFYEEILVNNTFAN